MNNNRKLNFNTYEEYLLYRREQASEWYKKNRERKKEYQRNYYKLKKQQREV